jgi:3-dehydroquinate dehydratase-2
MKILVANGPNLRLLGTRKPEVYGRETLGGIERRLQKVASELGVGLEFIQSDIEGEIVSAVGSAPANGFDGIVINPAAYTHTSVAIRDALEAAGLPAVEVHISNIYKREEFRHKSLTAPVCTGVICGLGTDGYEWALRALVSKLSNKRRSAK